MKDNKKSSKLDIMGMFGTTNKAQSKEGKKAVMTTNNSTSQATKIEVDKGKNPIMDEVKYKAFSYNSSGQAQFEIRLKNNRGLFIYYPLISHAEYEGNESLSIIYQNTAYIIKGRNFQNLKNHYRAQTIEYIQEFDPKIFDEVPEKNEAFIEEIEIIEPQED